MLLGWTQRRLAERAVVSVATVQRIERRKAMPRSATVAAVQRALVEGGIVFVSGEGVRLSTSNPAASSRP
jgi:transcriptional regulator with XRE-family HTH domain